VECALIFPDRLGFASSGLRAKLKAMAAEEQKNVLEHSPEAGAQENTTDVPSDGELFTDETHEPESRTDLDLSTLGAIKQLSEQEVFAGDEDFYKLLADSARDTAAQPDTGRFQQDLSQHKRFSSLQKILAVSIVAVVSMLLYVLLKSSSGLVSSSIPAFTQQAKPAKQQTGIFYSLKWLYVQRKLLISSRQAVY
jgi:hypothetical protein